MSNLTEQSEVIKSIDNAAHIENHVSPHCQIDGMSTSEYVRTNTLHQIEIARLNATIDRLKTEKLAMQVELDATIKEIINNPDNQYVPFYHVAEQIRTALGEVAI